LYVCVTGIICGTLFGNALNCDKIEQFSVDMQKILRYKGSELILLMQEFHNYSGFKKEERISVHLKYCSLLSA
jgi:hypothetical protein